MATASGLRIGDADREALAGELREHYAHGRLTLDEFQERLDATFAARTDLDLNEITRDLPHATAFAPPWPAALPQPDSRRDRGTHSQRSLLGGFAGLSWLLMVFLIVASLFSIFGTLAPRPLLILLAIFAFSRRILRRLMGGGRSMCTRGRRWHC